MQVLQRDAIDRLDLRQLLLEPEMLRAVEPDLHLVTLLVELNKLLPDTTRATARQVVAQVVEQIEQRLASRTKQAVHGALARSQRSRRPRLSDIDWGHTIHANLRHYLPEQRTVVPERLIGYGRRQRSLSRDVIVAIDQSGSMADSVVYAAVFGAVLASMPALRTSVIAFDSAVADLTPLLHDPVDVLFGVQLGGGTDIAQAIGYCQQLITRPADTVLVLVSDLFEGGNVGAAARPRRRAAPRRRHRGRAAGAQRRGRAGLRPRPGGGVRRARRAVARLHARRLPRSARRGARTSQRRSLGQRARPAHRGRHFCLIATEHLP